MFNYLTRFFSLVKLIYNHRYIYPKFSSLPLQSGFDTITVLINGLLVTIPSNYLSILKNLGVGFIFGYLSISAYVDVVVYPTATDVPLDNLQRQLANTLSEIDRLMSQIAGFTSQFHHFLNDNSINVITDAQGQLDIDVPNDISDELAEQHANRINVYDRLINTNINSVENRLERVSELEEQIREIDSNYVSQLPEYSDRLSRLIRLYGHRN